MLAPLTLQMIFGPVANLGATLPAGTAIQSFILEILLTAVLMFVIISVATDTRAVGQIAALAIGATVALDALWGGPISGASMNPARSFGPALIAGVWRDHWVYWLGLFFALCLGQRFINSFVNHPLRHHLQPSRKFSHYMSFEHAKSTNAQSMYWESAQSDGRSLDIDSRIREWMLEQGMKRVFPKAAVSP